MEYKQNNYKGGVSYWRHEKENYIGGALALILIVVLAWLALIIL